MKYESLNISSFIYELRKNLLIDSEVLCDVLEVDKVKLSDLSMASSSDLSFRQISNLSDFIGVPIEMMFDKKIDYSKIKNKLYTRSDKVPDKYQIGAGSFITGIRSMYHYISGVQGEKTANELLKNFDLNKAVILNDKNINNLILVNEVLDYCITNLGFAKVEVREMALKSYLDGQRKEVLTMASSCDSVKSFLELMINNADKYENNFKYDLLDIGNDKFIIRSESNQEINDLLKKSEISSLENNFYKSYVIELSPILVGLGEIKITGVQSTIVRGKQIVHYFIKLVAPRKNNKTVIYS